MLDWSIKKDYPSTLAVNMKRTDVLGEVRAGGEAGLALVPAAVVGNDFA